MGKIVKYTVRDGIAIVTFNNPPVNALSHAVRAGLVEALEAAHTDDHVTSVILRARGKTFPVGADINEFGKPAKDPSLPDVCAQIETMSKPVIAAIHGNALGGGFEVALASHYRIAQADARIGLPEVNLGILPGAGGTQRTPRLCGAKAALDLMVSGKPISAAKALEIGLLDKVVDDGVFAAAVELAREVTGYDRPLIPTSARREGMQDTAAYTDAVKTRRAELADSPLFSPHKIVDCVEAAMVFPIDAGMAFERAAFEECLNSDQSAGLRHAFLSERRAAKVPELATGVPREITSVGVIGGGTMGAGIAVSLLDAGLSVVMLERDSASLEVGQERVMAVYERSFAKGRISEEQMIARLTEFRGTLSYVDLAEVDLAIEAVIEDMRVKEAVFAQLDAVLKPGAILATNTSYLDVDALAATISRPEDVIGLHFFSPANIMKLLEVVVAQVTSDDVVATGFSLAKRLGKTAVRAGVTDGFIGNRIFKTYRAAVEFMVEDGTNPYDIDAAMRDFGFALGPFQVFDLAGLDIAWAQRKREAATRDKSARYVTFADEMCERGWFGQKTGRGYYRYQNGSRKGIQDPDVLHLIDATRAEKKITPRAFSAEEIQQRCLTAMVNEGAKLLQEGIALRPSDIDVVMLAGYGLARWRGGPMKTADMMGLMQIEKNLKAYAKEDALFWKAAPLIETLRKEGHGFEPLNARSI